MRWPLFLVLIVLATSQSFAQLTIKYNGNIVMQAREEVSYNSLYTWMGTNQYYRGTGNRYLPGIAVRGFINHKADPSAMSGLVFQNANDQAKFCITTGGQLLNRYPTIWWQDNYHDGSTSRTIVDDVLYPDIQNRHSLRIRKSQTLVLRAAGNTFIFLLNSVSGDGMPGRGDIEG